MLPFLEKKGWPRIRSQGGESRYGFSEDDELVEDALDELLASFHARDASKLIEAFMALIHVIKNKESHASIHEKS